jgi:hypothetical protein
MFYNSLSEQEKQRPEYMKACLEGFLQSSGYNLIRDLTATDKPEFITRNTRYRRLFLEYFCNLAKKANWPFLSYHEKEGLNDAEQLCKFEQPENFHIFQKCISVGRASSSPESQKVIDETLANLPKDLGNEQPNDADQKKQASFGWYCLIKNT